MRPMVCAALFLLASGCAATKRGLATPQESADALLAVALHRALVDPKDLPDVNLVDTGPEIVVRSTITGTTLRIAPSALPSVPGKKLLLLSKNEIDARAAKQGDVYFVAVDNLGITGDQATFTIGAAVATSPVHPMLCCCTAVVEYTRVKGSWSYKSSKGQVCA